MQLVLPVSFSKHNGFDTFVEGNNAHVLSFLQHMLSSNNSATVMSQRICFLDGTSGAGKSHLLLSISERAMHQGFVQQYINIKNIMQFPPEVLEGAMDNQVLCIDDIQAVAGNIKWETALFDLINQFVESNNTLLLLASNISINEIKLGLPDLKTRLQWGNCFTLQPLNDDDKLLALRKHSSALGLSVHDDALRYILTRVSRDMHDLLKQLETLDKASLQNKRKLTIPFVKSVLQV